MTKFAVVFDGAAHVLYVEDRRGPPYWRLARRQKPDAYHVSGPGGSRVLTYHPVLSFRSEDGAVAYAKSFLGKASRQVPATKMRRFWQGLNVIEQWESRRESVTLSTTFTLEAVSYTEMGTDHAPNHSLL